MVLDGKYEKTGFEKHYRHNGGDETIVFERDGKHYQTSYRWFEDDGISWSENYECHEVEKREVVTVKWVSVGVSKG